MDFVIVGGGVYGAGVAWDLAKRRAEVMLLEARQNAPAVCQFLAAWAYSDDTPALLRPFAYSRFLA
jgi:glycine/D-amino acid oxidase-like deaminating enzyme